MMLQLCSQAQQDSRKASKFFNKGKYSKGAVDSEIYKQFKAEAETIIRNCNYAKTMVKSPRKVLTENLGDTINSKYQEYAPAISLDERTLAYTSRRPTKKNEKVSDDGDYYEDIYISHLTKGSLFEGKEKDLDSKSGFFSLLTDFEYSKSIAPNVNIDGSDNLEGRALNRRVVFELIK